MKVVSAVCSFGLRGSEVELVELGSMLGSAGCGYWGRDRGHWPFLSLSEREGIIFCTPNRN